MKLSNGIWRRCAALGVVLSLFAGASLAHALSEKGAAVVLRVVAYDRNLDSRVDSDVVIGVATPDTTKSGQVLQSLKRLESLSLRKKSVRVLAVPFTNATDLQERLATLSVDALVVPDRVRGPSLGAVVEACTAAQIPSVGLSKAAVESGVAIAVEIGERVRIYVNADSANAQGARFSSDLLRLAIRIES